MKGKILNLSRVIVFVMLWTFSLSIMAQNVTVRGSVTDQNTEPLIGVTVQAQGITIGTVTDIDGNFMLANVPADAKLIVSYVGMNSQIVELNGRTVLDIVLLEDSELLQEVVVVGLVCRKKLILRVLLV